LDCLRAQARFAATVPCAQGGSQAIAILKFSWPPMLRIILLTLLALAIAIGGGAASVAYMLENTEGLGTLRIGGWTAYPDYGTEHADPYSKARIAREAELPLGGAEGLSFTAHRDTAGRQLRRDCTYVIVGPVPPGRFWTLYATDASHETITSAGRRRAALHSYELLRKDGDTFEIAVSSHPFPGNWLAVPGTGAMSLVLTLYDTPVASSASIADIRLPQITRTACDG
jgi:hypothetical protein